MSYFTLNEIEKIFNVKLNLDIKSTKYTISTDSRDIKENQIFIPIVGLNFDGHSFINQVLEKYHSTISFCEYSRSNCVKEGFKERIIFIDKTLDAYQKLANYIRKKINPKVVAITGSSGKTTMKDLLFCILKQKYKTQKTEKNFNNEIGIPKTILDLNEDAEVIVMELAMRGIGQISELSKICEPDIALITNIGTAHIGILKSRENIAKAKFEITDYLKKDGFFISFNEPLIRDIIKTAPLKDFNMQFFDLVDVSNIYVDNGKTKFTYLNEEYNINQIGNIHILNSIAAILVAKKLGLNHNQIQNGLNEFTVPLGRGEAIVIRENKIVIDETYNANPDSVKAAAEILVKSFDSKVKKIFVLGELGELGEHENHLFKELESFFQSLLETNQISTLITLGDLMSVIKCGQSVKNVKNVKTNKDCFNLLCQEIDTNENIVITLKGSRVAKLDEVITLLKENQQIRTKEIIKETK